MDDLRLVVNDEGADREDGREVAHESDQEEEARNGQDYAGEGREA